MGRRDLPLYGVAECGMSAVEIFLRYYLLHFYTSAVGLRPDFAGFAIGAAVLWDAVTDPFMGWIVDRARSSRLSPKTLLALGCLITVVTFAFLFNPPEIDSQLGKLAYLFVAYAALNSGTSIMGIPYLAWADDLAENADEVTTMYGWRNFFGNVGVMLGASLPSSGRETTLSIVAALVGSCAVTLLVRDRAIRPRTTRGRSERLTLGMLRSAWANQPFRLLFLAYVLGTVGVAVFNSSALYYYRFRLGLDEGQASQVIVAFTAAYCLSLGAWVWLAKRFAKSDLVFGGVAVLGAISAVAYPLLPSGAWQAAIALAVVTGALGGSTSLLEAVLVDVSHRDAASTGQKRLGLFFGLWKMGAKGSRAVALALTGNLLLWFGYADGAASASVATTGGIALLYGPVVGAWLLCAAVCCWLLGRELKRPSEDQRRPIARHARVATRS